MGDLDGKYTVDMEDGRQLEVSTDQRDWAAMEVMDFPRGAGVTATRYMAYSALRRTGKYNGAWDRFNGVDCRQVDALAEPPAAAELAAEEGEEEQGADPTPASSPGPSTTSAASTSRSPARRAKPSRKS